MSIQEIREQRHEVMVGFEQEFVDELVPARLDRDEDSDLEVLTVIMEDLAEEGLENTGEFFFMPMVADDEDMQIFSSVITVLEEVDPQNIGELVAAIVTVNALLPFGCFAINPGEGTLVYKHNYEMDLPLDSEKLRMNLNMCMNLAVQTVRNYAYALVEVNEGERTAESVILLLSPGSVEEEEEGGTEGV